MASVGCFAIIFIASMLLASLPLLPTSLHLATGHLQHQTMSQHGWPRTLTKRKAKSPIAFLGARPADPPHLLHHDPQEWPQPFAHQSMQGKQQNWTHTVLQLLSLLGFSFAFTGGIRALWYLLKERPHPHASMAVFATTAVSLRSVHRLSGHTSGVYCVACSPVGPLCASSSWDCTIRVWDIDTGELVHILTGHKDMVFSVAFSPKGGRIVSGGWDNTVRIWDTRTGKLCLTMQAHSNMVYSVTFTPDGLKVISCSRDTTVRIWDAQTGQLLQTLDGRVIVLRATSQPLGIENGSTARLRDPDIGPLVRRMVGGPLRAINGLAMSPDGRRLFGAGADQSVKVWDFTTGELIGTLHGHEQQVYSVAVSPDSKWLLSGSSDQTVKVWNAETGGLHRTIKLNRCRKVITVAFSPNGDLILAAGGQNEIRIYGAKKGKLVAILNGPQQPAHSATFSFDGQKVVAGSFDTTVSVWDISAVYDVLRQMNETEDDEDDDYDDIFDGEERPNDPFDDKTYHGPPAEQLQGKRRLKDEPIT